MIKLQTQQRNRLSRTSISRGDSLPGSDDIVRVVLPNGITVLVRENSNSLSIAVSGYLLAGGLSDPDEKLGLADFTASALMRGTQNRDFQQIYNALESVGASLGFDSGTHTTGFGGKALSEDLDLLLELLADSLRWPIFPGDHLERLRAQLLTGLAIRAQDTADMAAMAFDQIVYAGHPYSRPEDGFPETVQAITQKDIIDFHSRHYGPSGLVIAITGLVNPEQTVDRVIKHFGDWHNPAQEKNSNLPPLLPIDQTITRRVTIPGKYQADIVIGAAGPSRKSPDYMPASLGNNVLGQFGMMGRIGEVVRERAGLAYYASSSLGGGTGPGPWRVSAGVDPANADKAVDLIRFEIDRFVKQGITEEEIADSQANFIGRLPLSLESNSGVAGAILNLERYELGLDYYRHYADQVRAIQVDDVLAASRKYLDPDRLGIAIAGPK